LIAYEQHFAKAVIFALGRKSFRRFLKDNAINLPQTTDIYIALAGNTMSAFVYGDAKLDVVDQFLMKIGFGNSSQPFFTTRQLFRNIHTIRNIVTISLFSLT
jgi:hypothetical protein